MEDRTKPLKIVIVGPESTGKTWLCEQLALHYKVPWIPEYARTYLEQNPGEYTLKDLILISRGQLEEEYKATQKSNHLLIVDTNMLVMKVWMEHAFQHSHSIIEESLLNYEYDLTLLTNIDVPWIPDPLREHPHLREYFMKVYRDLLISYKIEYMEITNASFEDRLKQAISAIDELILKNQHKG